MQESVRKKINDRFTKAQVAQAARDLSATAKLWENGYQGWLQGRNFDQIVDPTSCCSYGGLLLVTGERHGAASDYDSRTTAAACCFLYVTGQDVVSYNDTDGRTKAGVIQTMQDVARALAEYAQPADV